MSDTSNQIDPRSHKYIEIEISDGKGVGSIAGDYIDRITPDLYQIVRSIAQILELIYWKGSENKTIASQRKNLPHAPLPGLVAKITSDKASPSKFL